VPGEGVSGGWWVRTATGQSKTISRDQVETLLQYNSHTTRTIHTIFHDHLRTAKIPSFPLTFPDFLRQWESCINTQIKLAEETEAIRQNRTKNLVNVCRQFLQSITVCEIFSSLNTSACRDEWNNFNRLTAWPSCCNYRMQRNRYRSATPRVCFRCSHFVIGSGLGLSTTADFQNSRPESQSVVHSPSLGHIHWGHFPARTILPHFLQQTQIIG